MYFCAYARKAKDAINEFNSCLSGNLDGCDNNEQAKLIVESITYKCKALDIESAEEEGGGRS